MKNTKSFKQLVLLGAFLLIMALLLFTTACKEENLPKIKSLSFDCDKIILPKDGDIKIKLNIEKTEEDERTMKEIRNAVELTSSEPEMVEIGTDGAVTGKSFGECSIIASFEGITAELPVTVAEKWCALTFDDGPAEYTKDLLDFGKEENVQFTFFLVGKQIEQFPKIVKREAKLGHEIGNHSWDHAYSANNVTDRFMKVEKKLKKLIGSKATVLRPPGGFIYPELKEFGEPIIMWSVDPQDWATRNEDTNYDRVMSGAFSGSIILLHDIHKPSVAAAKRIIPALKEQNYALVTVSTLIGNPEAGKTYYEGRKEVVPTKIKY
jgi:peptidoglycan/xylan/chitin deacetylase (PgdA/CDA1 family)